MKIKILKTVGPIRAGQFIDNAISDYNDKHETKLTLFYMADETLQMVLDEYSERHFASKKFYNFETLDEKEN